MSEVFDVEAGQPLPVTNKASVDVATAVVSYLKEQGYCSIAEKIEERIRIGERKYGKRLQSFNGRDTFKDLLEECLDALNYSKQAELEGLDNGYLFKSLIPITVEVERCINKANDQRKNG